MLPRIPVRAATAYAWKVSDHCEAGGGLCSSHPNSFSVDKERNAVALERPNSLARSDRPTGWLEETHSIIRIALATLCVLMAPVYRPIDQQAPCELRYT